MDLSNAVKISSLDSKIPVSETPKQDLAQKSQSKQIIEKSITIDEKFNDKLSVKQNSEINATVIAKSDDGKYTLKLADNKTIEIKISADLSINDKITVQVADSKISNIIIKNQAETVILNKADFATLVNAIKTSISQDIVNNKPINLDLKILASLISNKQSIDLNLLENIKISLNFDSKAAEFITKHKNIAEQNAPVKLDLETLKIILNEKSNITNPIKNIEFKDSAVKLILDVLTKNNTGKELDLKVLDQTMPKTIQTSLNNNIKLDLNMQKAETIFNKLITISQEKTTASAANTNIENSIIKTDSKNIIESIKVSPETFKNLIQPIKQELASKINLLQNNHTTSNPTKNLSFDVKIVDNKVIIPSLDNLSIKIPVKLNAENLANTTPKLNIEINPKTSRPEVILNTGKETIKLENLDIALNSKIVNKQVNNLIQASQAVNFNSQQVVLKSSNMFEILLSVNNNLTDLKNLSFNLNDNSKIILNQPTSTANTSNIELNKQTIPSLANKHTLPLQMTLMFAAAISANQTSKIADKDADIFSLILESLPEGLKPRLQATSNNEGFRYFNFPYYQEDDILRYGEMTYQQTNNEHDQNITNLALKIEFSNIGETMLKLKTIDKSISINIYTKKDLTAEDTQDLLKTSQKAIENSGFSGTVALKKTNSIEMPLLNSEKIGYSGINLEI